MSEAAAVRVVVSGRVQGVGFRAWTERCALALNLAGYVRNLEGGEVEVVAEGEREAVEHLVGLLAEGPRTARVRTIKVEKAPWTGGGGGFRIG